MNSSTETYKYHWTTS